MDKYYKTLRTSETGQKFEAVLRKKDVAHKELNALRKKYGFGDSYSSGRYVFGGIFAGVFETPPDSKLWVQDNCAHNAYRPRLNSKAGKAIAAEFQAVTTVTRYELNMCIGFDDVWQGMGLIYSNPKYIGFVVHTKWGAKIPSDCEEITGSEYEQLNCK